MGMWQRSFNNSVHGTLMAFLIPQMGLITILLTSALGNSFNLGLLWAFSSIMVFSPWWGKTEKWFRPTFLEKDNDEKNVFLIQNTYRSFKLFKGTNASSCISVMLFFSRSLYKETLFIIPYYQSFSVQLLLTLCTLLETLYIMLENIVLPTLVFDMRVIYFVLCILIFGFWGKHICKQ